MASVDQGASQARKSSAPFAGVQDGVTRVPVTYFKFLGWDGSTPVRWISRSYVTARDNLTNITVEDEWEIAEEYFVGDIPEPLLVSCLPAIGPVAGSTPISALRGQNFVSGCTVTIGGVPATSVVFVSPSLLTCVTPAGSLGVKNVVVTNPDGKASGESGRGLYTYSSFTGQLGDVLSGLSNIQPGSV